jgi:DNA-binding beta-propeller fold protein YncE
MHLARRPAFRRAVSALALAVLASGCASVKKPPRGYVYPPPPDVTRIKWVRSFLSEDDLQLSAWRRLWKAIIPHDSSNALVAPTSLALSPDETTVYAAVPHRRRVVVANLKTNRVSALGTNATTGLNKPIGVAVDGQGLVYVSDKNANTIVVFSPDGAQLRRFGREQLNEPTGIAIDRRAQLLYVVNDASNQAGRHCVEVFSLAGKHLRTIGGPRSDEAGRFNFPRSVAVSRTGELHVVDMLNFRVQVFDAQGRLLRMFGEPGSGFPGKFDKIHAVGFDAFENVYVADALQGVHILNADAQPLMMFGPPVSPSPTALVVSSRNTIYVGDMMHGIHEFQLVNTTAADSRPARPSSAPPTAPAAAEGTRSATKPAPVDQPRR